MVFMEKRRWELRALVSPGITVKAHVSLNVPSKI